MKTEVTEEKNEYKDGVRVNVQTIMTESTLADDIAKQANYMNAYAVHVGTLEKLRAEVLQDESKQYMYVSEIKRIEEEIEILKAAIKIQEGFIGGYDGNK